MSAAVSFFDIFLPQGVVTLKPRLVKRSAHCFFMALRIFQGLFLGRPGYNTLPVNRRLLAVRGRPAVWLRWLTGAALQGLVQQERERLRRKSIKAFGQRDAKTRLDQMRGERAEMVPEPFLQAGRRWGWWGSHPIERKASCSDPRSRPGRSVARPPEAGRPLYQAPRQKQRGASERGY